MVGSTSPPTAEGCNPSPAEAIEIARKLWLTAACQSDIDKVERLYWDALSSKAQPTNTSQKDDDGSTVNDAESSDNYADGPPKKKTKSAQHCGLTPSQFNQAGEKLALLLCQSGRCKKAKKGLASMGFTCRLAKQVLDYPLCDNNETVGETTANTIITDDQKKERRKNPCQIIDGFLSQSELGRLRSVFASPTASYWTDHNYAVEPPSPYFSYVIPLDDILSSDDDGEKKEFGFIGDLTQRIMSCPHLNEKFPKLERKANFVEFWAHNRPHASGHQMHFDSDDEGRGGVRNPIISTILYITADDTTTNLDEGESKLPGGPSLVTNQKLTDIRLATQGWMAHPKSQRLVAFDGRYLHGVVPGKGFQKGRRVTLMMAFWEDIQIRRGVGPGSARPFPTNNLPEWASQLVSKMEGDGKCNNNYDSCVETEPIKLDRIYETLDGKPWKRGMGMPAYDSVFQGF